MNDTPFPQRIPAGQPVTMFNKALHHGWLHNLWAMLTRQCFCLSDLDEMLKSSPVESSHYAGIKPVPIRCIHGTQGKADEFDAEFNPTQERSRSRWISIALEKLKGRDLPPVELVLVNGVYYVRDGHHRISVSRALGQDFVDAEITVMQLRQLGVGR
jgi:hypothetical protein